LQIGKIWSCSHKKKLVVKIFWWSAAVSGGGQRCKVVVNGEKGKTFAAMKVAHKI